MPNGELSLEKRAELCGHGEIAYQTLRPRQKSVRFKWRGVTYVARRSRFRMFIEDAEGDRVAFVFDEASVS